MTVPMILAAVVAALAGCSGSGWSGPLGALAGESESGSPAVRVPPSATPSASGSGLVEAAAAGAAASASASVGDPPVASVTPSPSVSIAVLVPPDLMAARGYTYAKAPKTVAQAFTPVASGYRGVLSAPTVRAVKRNKVNIGTAAVMAVEPSHFEDPEVVSTLLTGLVTGMSGKGYTLRTRSVTVAGAKRNVVVALKSGSTIAAWLDNDCVVAMVSSGPEEPVLAFARAYLAG